MVSRFFSNTPGSPSTSSAGCVCLGILIACLRSFPDSRSVVSGFPESTANCISSNRRQAESHRAELEMAEARRRKAEPTCRSRYLRHEGLLCVLLSYRLICLSLKTKIYGAMKSKGYLRFMNRIHFFAVDHEVMDVIKINSDKLAGEDHIFLNVTKSGHPKLYNHTNNQGTRDKLINHLRNTLYVSFIKELYEEVTEYMRYILFHGAKAAPNKQRFVGEHRVTFKANDILTAGDHDAIIKMVVDDIYQSLEAEKSTVDLLNKTKSKLDLTVDNTIIEEALPYLLLRHIFVHSDGKPNQEFQTKYPQINFKNVKGRIILSKKLLKDARIKIERMIHTFDNEMITKGYFPSEELQS